MSKWERLAAVNRPVKTVVRLDQMSAFEKLDQTQGNDAARRPAINSLARWRRKFPLHYQRAVFRPDGMGIVQGIDGGACVLKRLHKAIEDFELAKRISAPEQERFRVSSPADLFTLVSDMQYLEQEQMRVVLLNTKHRVIKVVTVYQGSVHTTVIRVAELLREAIRWNATAIALAHNHPSSDPTPSPEDAAITREIVKAGSLMDIDIADHIVVGQGGRFVSLRERGLGFQ